MNGTNWSSLADLEDLIYENQKTVASERYLKIKNPRKKPHRRVWVFCFSGQFGGDVTPTLNVERDSGDIKQFVLQRTGAVILPIAEAQPVMTIGQCSIGLHVRRKGILLSGSDRHSCAGSDKVPAGYIVPLAVQLHVNAAVVRRVPVIKRQIAAVEECGSADAVGRQF